MIIWSGRGFLVAIIVFLNSIIGELLCKYITNNDGYYQNNSWVFTIILALSGVMCWYLGKYMNGPKYDKVYIDKETGKEVHVRKNNTFFFIKVQYWGIILPIAALINLFTT